MIEIIKLLVITLASTFVAGQVFRVAVRFKYCQPITAIGINCCIDCKKRFRLVELIPVFGSILTMVKCSEHKDNYAKIALLIETNCFFIVPILYIFVYSLVLQLFLFFAIIVILSVMLISDGDSTELA